MKDERKAKQPIAVSTGLLLYGTYFQAESRGTTTWMRSNLNVSNSVLCGHALMFPQPHVVDAWRLCNQEGAAKEVVKVQVVVTVW